MYREENEVSNELPKKKEMYQWKMHRMGGTTTGIVSATTKAVALKKLKKRNKIFRNNKITLRKS